MTVIRETFTGKQVSHDGEHHQVETARLYSLPGPPPPIHISGFGPTAARVAAPFALIAALRYPVSAPGTG